MKKILIMFMIVLLSGCTTVRQEEVEKPQPVAVKEKLYDVPKDFKEDAVDGNYNDFLLGSQSLDTYVYLEGEIVGIDVVESNGKNAYCGIYADSDNNLWILIMDLESLAEADTYNSLLKHPSAIVSRYVGNSDDEDNTPSLGLVKLFDKKTGKTTISSLFSVQDYNSLLQEDTQPQQETETVDESVIRPEIKQAIDSYESFIEEYCQIIEIYNQSGGADLSVLTKYASMMAKYSEMESQMEKLEEDLTDAELMYYSEVILRCNNRILQASN